MLEFHGSLAVPQHFDTGACFKLRGTSATCWFSILRLRRSHRATKLQFILKTQILARIRRIVSAAKGISNLKLQATLCGWYH